MLLLLLLLFSFEVISYRFQHNSFIPWFHFLNFSSFYFLLCDNRFHLLLLINLSHLLSSTFNYLLSLSDFWTWCLWLIYWFKNNIIIPTQLRLYSLFLTRFFVFNYYRLNWFIWFFCIDVFGTINSSTRIIIIINHIDNLFRFSSLNIYLLLINFMNNINIILHHFLSLSFSFSFPSLMIFNRFNNNWLIPWLWTLYFAFFSLLLFIFLLFYYWLIWRSLVWVRWLRRGSLWGFCWSWLILGFLLYLWLFLILLWLSDLLFWLLLLPIPWLLCCHILLACWSISIAISLL